MKKILFPALMMINAIYSENLPFDPYLSKADQNKVENYTWQEFVKEEAGKGLADETIKKLYRSKGELQETIKDAFKLTKDKEVKYAADFVDSYIVKNAQQLLQQDSLDYDREMDNLVDEVVKQLGTRFKSLWQKILELLGWKKKPDEGKLKDTIKARIEERVDKLRIAYDKVEEAKRLIAGLKDVAYPGDFERKLQEIKSKLDESDEIYGGKEKYTALEREKAIKEFTSGFSSVDGAPTNSMDPINDIKFLKAYQELGGPDLNTKILLKELENKIDFLTENYSVPTEKLKKYTKELDDFLKNSDYEPFKHIKAAVEKLKQEIDSQARDGETGPHIGSKDGVDGQDGENGENGGQPRIEGDL